MLMSSLKVIYLDLSYQQQQRTFPQVIIEIFCNPISNSKLDIFYHVCFTLQIIITFPLTILIIKCLVCIAKPGGSLLVPWFAHTHTVKSDHINYILIRFEWSNTHNIVKFLCYFHIRSWHGLDFRPMGKRQTVDCGSPIFLWLRRFIVVYGVILGSDLSNLYPLTPLKDAHVTTSAW